MPLDRIAEAFEEVGRLATTLAGHHRARKGYPDVDLNPFFQPHGLTQTEAKSLIRKLKESLKEDEKSTPP